MRAAIIHANVKPEVVMISEDKLWKCLTEWKAGIEARGRWIAPLSLAASLSFCLSTSQFHDFLGISKEVWNSTGILSLGASLVWLIYEIARLLQPQRRKTGSVEALIEIMKRGAIAIPISVGDNHPPR
jgi:hypothetical protein